MRVSMAMPVSLNSVNGWLRGWALVCVLVLTSCTGIPKNVEPVGDFDVDRYLGTWYEIARLDHRFERGLRNVTAEYSLRSDGGLVVRNRGYAENKGEWKESVGKAYFAKDTDKGHLKVSFFGPFYGSYVVFELDKENYQYAFISGNNTNYLWLLSRTPEVPEELIERFKSMASELGFATDELIFVDQSPVD